MMNNNSPYTAAITGGGFLFTETNALLPLLQSNEREELLKDEKLNNRLLKINAETSRYRAIVEIARRYDTMSASFWIDYQSMNEKDQMVALFFVRVSNPWFNAWIPCAACGNPAVACSSPAKLECRVFTPSFRPDTPAFTCCRLPIS